MARSTDRPAGTAVPRVLAATLWSAQHWRPGAFLGSRCGQALASGGRVTDTDHPATAVAVFYSYAHEDEALRDELAGHLKILERRGLIRAWHDRKIVAGADWAAAIDENLDRADLVLLLVSKDFVESEYIFGVELKRAMQRHADRACDVVPIIVRAVNIEPEDRDVFPFMALQCLPTDMKPVTSWPNRDEAWTNVAKGLRATVAAVRARQPAPPAAAPGPAPRATRGAPARSGAGVDGPTPAGAAPPADDAVLAAVVANVLQQVDTAESARGGAPVGAQARARLADDTRALIDVPEQQRVLWVDDRPENNRFETATLAKLQIEVVAVRSTDEALARLASDAAAGEPFDLVLTDWTRPDESDPAALSLLRRMREAGQPMPVVVYHGESDPGRRGERAAQCSAAGALGEAVLPSELMALVHRALAGV
jgi:CheY-like chemotaxis protein